MRPFYNLTQGTEEWFAIKKGKPSASQFDNIITAARGELSKSHAPYIRELISECFCPTYQEWLGSAWTKRGNELEPLAREAFANHTGYQLKQVGFIMRDEDNAGCSPDSLVLDDSDEIVAGLEIKCPSPKVHVGYVLDGVLPDAYKQQVHGSMVVTGLNRWHFWSFYPGMKPLHVIVERDGYTAKLEAALDEFMALYEAEYMRALPLLAVEESDTGTPTKELVAVEALEE